MPCDRDLEPGLRTNSDHGSAGSTIVSSPLASLLLLTVIAFGIYRKTFPPKACQRSKHSLSNVAFGSRAALFPRPRWAPSRVAHSRGLAFTGRFSNCRTCADPDSRLHRAICLRDTHERLSLNVDAGEFPFISRIRNGTAATGFLAEPYAPNSH